MREIRTVVDIDAPPPDVWNVLIDFAKYGEWNPFVRSLDGTPALGEQLVAMLGATGKEADEGVPPSPRNTMHRRVSHGSGR